MCPVPVMTTHCRLSRCPGNGIRATVYTSCWRLVVVDRSDSNNNILYFSLLTRTKTPPNSNGQHPLWPDRHRGRRWVPPSFHSVLLKHLMNSCCPPKLKTYFRISYLYNMFLVYLLSESLNRMIVNDMQFVDV